MRDITQLPHLQSRIRSSFLSNPGHSRFLLLATNKRDWGEGERPHPCKRILTYCGFEAARRGGRYIVTMPDGKVAIPAEWIEENLVWPELHGVALLLRLSGVRHTGE